MKKRFVVLSLFLAILLLASCQQDLGYESQSFFAMDSFAELRIYSEEDGSEEILGSGKELVDEIENAIAAQWEDGDADQQVDQASGMPEDSPYFSELLNISLEMSEITNGCFDVKIGALLNLWSLCQKEQRLPTEEEIEHALSFLDEAVTSPDMELDFSAIGKGYTADKVVDFLRESGVDCGLVSFVSTIFVFGEREEGAFRVPVRRPDSSGHVAGYVTMQDESLSFSGEYIHHFDINGFSYSHILDPKTGRPVDNGIHGAAVVAKTGAVSDALSTAIMVMGLENALQLYNSGVLDFEAIIFLGNEVLITDGLVDRFELDDSSYQAKLLSQYMQ